MDVGRGVMIRTNGGLMPIFPTPLAQDPMEYNLKYLLARQSCFERRPFILTLSQHQDVATEDYT